MEKKKIDALIYAKQYYSAVRYYKIDPYFSEHAAFFRKMAIRKLRKVHDKQTKRLVKTTIKETDHLLRKEKKEFISTLSKFSDMDKKELKYLEKI
ncbi:hypothetical protein JYK00_09450 [Thermosipho ferrireducens]|uniref:Uncharacterized protein n=1 Tax=Thermosipho ferrireducens TaxID=2571116 RepID=A0ABX7S5U1_9BACT|nr:hypothetical protein [Thermosipho ferrireducens]QTA37927.1 hypothetical protein JYK00_09450 [Thermosipho ferrireducens]